MQRVFWVKKLAGTLLGVCFFLYTTRKVDNCWYEGDHNEKWKPRPEKTIKAKEWSFFISMSFIVWSKLDLPNIFTIIREKAKCLEHIVVGLIIVVHQVQCQRNMWVAIVAKYIVLWNQNKSYLQYSFPWLKYSPFCDSILQMHSKLLHPNPFFR